MNIGMGKIISTAQEIAVKYPKTAKVLKKSPKYIGLAAGYGMGLASVFSGAGIPLLLGTGTIHALSRISSKSKDQLQFYLPYASGAGFTLASLAQPLLLVPGVLSFGLGMKHHYDKIKDSNLIVDRIKADTEIKVNLRYPVEGKPLTDYRIFTVGVEGRYLDRLQESAQIKVYPAVNTNPEADLQSRIENTEVQPNGDFTGLLSIRIPAKLIGFNSTIEISIFSKVLETQKTQKACLKFEPGTPWRLLPLDERIKTGDNGQIKNLLDELINGQISLSTNLRELTALRIELDRLLYDLGGGRLGKLSTAEQESLTEQINQLLTMVYNKMDELQGQA